MRLRYDHFYEIRIEIYFYMQLSQSEKEIRPTGSQLFNQYDQLVVRYLQSTFTSVIDLKPAVKTSQPN